MLKQQDMRLRRINLLIRDLNRQLKMAADQKVPVDLAVEDITKQSDTVRRFVIKSGPVA